MSRKEREGIAVMQGVRADKLNRVRIRERVSAHTFKPSRSSALRSAGDPLGLETVQPGLNQNSTDVATKTVAAVCDCGFITPKGAISRASRLGGRFYAIANHTFEEHD